MFRSCSWAHSIRLGELNINALCVMCYNGNPQTGAIARSVVAAVYGMSVAFIQVAPGVFCTYFYNHAHRLRFEKILYCIWSFLGVPTDFFNHFWI
jgi:hypothetical protein